MKKFFTRNWLIESVILILVTSGLTIGVTYLTDSYYQKTFVKKLTENSQKQKPTLTLVTGTTTTKKTATTKTSGTKAPKTSTTGTKTGSTSTTPPTSSPPPSPPPAPSGCFVTVAGYLYNMQPAVGVRLTDPNTGKTKTHSSGNFQCGTYSAPTNMTNVYLSKHSGLGCAARLAPYIYTPPAPKDPTC